jgi:hypothetical protein
MLSHFLPQSLKANTRINSWLLYHFHNIPLFDRRMRGAYKQHWGCGGEENYNKTYASKRTLTVQFTISFLLTTCSLLKAAI